MSAVNFTFTAHELFEIKGGIKLRIRQLEKWAEMPAGPCEARGLAEELEVCKAVLAKVEAA
jgi:hypothetical protein